MASPPQAPGPAQVAPAPPSSGSVPRQKRGPSVHQIYALPAPIRTFPLPTFYPSNPVSLLHVLSAWLGQVFSPPPTEPSAVHWGVWSETTTSVHVADEKSMGALWEQGFYGKGSLSRSEPNWLKREQVRRGLGDAHVSEMVTAQRRQERAQAKWERARLEQEAIRSTRLEEARLVEARRQASLARSAPPRVPVAPVGPLEIVSLPNSDAELSRAAACPDEPWPGGAVVSNGAVNGLAFACAVPGRGPSVDARLNGSDARSEACDKAQGGDLDEPGDCTNGAFSDGAEGKPLKQRKSVRFSATVESTFQLSDPPSPNRTLASAKASQLAESNDNSVTPSTADSDFGEAAAEAEAIVNREHLQLTPEEAFFLSFGLGALGVTDPASGKALSTRDMLTLFRRHSYFPPRVGPEEAGLEPDDGFLVHYAVYHHFRSLGWVPRAGIKFGVDWLLYTRGPVFDHAEFGLIVVPSYSDAWWKASGKQEPRKTWPWLHGVVRVLSHVMKSLVLVYVDVPPLLRFEEALKGGVTEALRLYQVREVTVKRWSSNRNR